MYQPVQDDDFINDVKKVGMEHLIPEMLKVRHNAILLKISDGDDSVIPIGASKYGGNPDLPWNIPYPTVKKHKSFRYTHEPIEIGQGISRLTPTLKKVPIIVPKSSMQLLAQINISDVKPFDRDNLLPEKGLLYFFYNGEDLDDLLGSDKVKVIYSACDNVSKLKRKLPPAPFVGENIPNPFPNMKIEPDRALYEFDVSLQDTSWTYKEEFEELDEHLEISEYNENQTKMFGVPNGINITNPNDDEVNLLALDLEFGCLHTIYWYIKLKDLKKLKFDNIYFMPECD
ncbi:MAG: DUF1963 domain-containing protein [Ruminococcus sp.]|jgi:uncharacterized protein YwqG|nr:DUF1963 domain-containing protein [Ruminococcus sp.]